MQMQLKNSFTVNQSLDRIWYLMAVDFANIGSWATSIESSQATSSPNNSKLASAPCEGRVCHAPGFGDVEETITHFDEAEKRFGYRAKASAMPSFVNTMENNWSFKALSETQTQASTHAIMDLKYFPGILVAPFMRIRMNQMANVFAEDLKHYAETGEVSEAKRKAILSLNQSLSHT